MTNENSLSPKNNQSWKWEKETNETLDKSKFRVIARMRNLSKSPSECDQLCKIVWVYDSVRAMHAISRWEIFAAM